MGFLDNLLRTMASRPEGREADESERLRGEVVRLYQEGQFREAEVVARRVVELQRELAGEDHPDFATALSNLALLVQRQGDLDAAEPLLRQALEVRRETLGEHHADYASGLNNLALLLCEKRDLDAAEPLLRQALEVRRETLGEHHPDYATGLGSLALLLCERRDLEAAEPLLRQAVEVRGLALGEHHPDYATSLNNLALLLCERQDLDAAEPLLRQALEVRRESLGEHHPDTASSADSLASLLRGKGDAVGAAAVAGPAPAPGSGWDLPGPAARAVVPPRPFDNHAAAIAPAAVHHGDSPRPRGSSILAEELDALSRRFATASELMLQEAAGMQAQGHPPDPVVLATASACHRDFMALRAEAMRLAETLLVRSHPAERVVGLPELAELLEATAHAEAAATRQEQTRRDALDVLDRVLALTCRDAEDRPHLDECRAQARVLHDAISTCPAPELPREAERLGRGDHPLACLLALVQDQDEDSGDLWADQYRETAATFGRTLAVAAARGRLSLRSGPTPPAVESPEESPAVEAGLEAEAV